MTHDTHPTSPTHTHTPHPKFWGDVKKTSPMKGKVFFTGDKQTDIHTDGHRDSMTESAQWANSVKIITETELNAACSKTEQVQKPIQLRPVPFLEAIQTAVTNVLSYLNFMLLEPATNLIDPFDTLPF